MTEETRIFDMGEEGMIFEWSPIVEMVDLIGVSGRQILEQWWNIIDRQIMI